MSKKPAKSKDQHRSNRLVRLSEEHYQTLKALAARNRRPLTWELAWAIEVHHADLLAVCEEVLARIEEFTIPEDEPMRDAATLLRAAIARAKGETQ